MRYSVQDNILEYAAKLKSGEFGTTLENKTTDNLDGRGENISGKNFRISTAITQDLYRTGKARLLSPTQTLAWELPLKWLGLIKEDIERITLIVENKRKGTMYALRLYAEIFNDECYVSLIQVVDKKEETVICIKSYNCISTQAQDRYIFDVLIDNPMVIAWRTFVARDKNISINIFAHAVVLTKFEYIQFSIFVFNLFNIAIIKERNAVLIENNSNIGNYKHLTLIANECSDISKLSRSYILKFGDDSVCSMGINAADTVGVPVYMLSLTEEGKSFKVLRELRSKEFLTNEDSGFTHPIYDLVPTSNLDNYNSGIAILKTRSNAMSTKVRKIRGLLDEKVATGDPHDIGFWVSENSTSEQCKLTLSALSAYDGSSLGWVTADYKDAYNLVVNKKVIRPYNDISFNIDCIVFNQLILQARNVVSYSKEHNNVIVTIKNEDGSPFSLSEYSASIFCQYVKPRDGEKMYKELISSGKTLVSVTLEYDPDVAKSVLVIEKTTP